jgi:hypothetical protein
MFTHDSQADRILPGEANLWTQLEAQVSRRALEKNVLDAGSGDSQYNHQMPDRDRDYGGGRENSEGVHMVTHIGNFLSVDRFLRASAIQLLHEICNDDIAADVWKDQLHKIETKLREHYRSTLTDNPVIRRSLRLCGHVFLCGPAEAGGSGLDDLFAIFFPSLAGSPGPPVDEAVALQASEGGKKLRSDDSRQEQEQEEEEQEEEEEKIWSSVGEAATADRDNKYSYTLKLSRDQRQAAKLVYGMLLRVAR